MRAAAGLLTCRVVLRPSSRKISVMKVPVTVGVVGDYSGGAVLTTKSKIRFRLRVPEAFYSASSRLRIQIVRSL
jgi:hypothetical protein